MRSDTSAHASHQETQYSSDNNEKPKCIHHLITDHTRKKGTMVTARRNEQEITRNASHFKHIKLEPGTVIIDCENVTEEYIPATEADIPPSTDTDHAEMTPSRTDRSEMTLDTNASPAVTTSDSTTETTPGYD